MSRLNIEEISRRFADLHFERCRLVRSAKSEMLFFANAHASSLLAVTPASLLVRSAAAVEQAINGITVRLWDDPFEWTLPERLSTVDLLIAYFDEVEIARTSGFRYLKDDSDLDRALPAPVEFKTLDRVLADTLAISERYISEASLLLYPR